MYFALAYPLLQLNRVEFLLRITLDCICKHAECKNNNYTGKGKKH